MAPVLAMSISDRNPQKKTRGLRYSTLTFKNKLFNALHTYYTFQLPHIHLNYSLLILLDTCVDRSMFSVASHYVLTYKISQTAS